MATPKRSHEQSRALLIQLSPEERDGIKSAAAAAGTTVRNYVLTAVRAAVEAEEAERIATRVEKVYMLEEAEPLELERVT